MSAVIERLVRDRALAQAGNLTVRLARGAPEVEAAQRLRYQVFAEEGGARIAAGDGLDRDAFDRFCEHLVVCDERLDRVVGTYRVMLPDRAREIGRLYTEGEFRLGRLEPIRADLVELGRSCVHPDYRSGAAIMLLWAGLGEMLGHLPYRYVIGCASVPMADGGHYAASLYRRLVASHAAAERLRVFPKDRLPIESLYHDLDVVVPPLIKAYLRAGGKVLGEPHCDPTFGCADFPMILSMDRISTRYARRFLPGRPG
jgi:putative hemolysin